MKDLNINSIFSTFFVNSTEKEMFLKKKKCKQEKVYTYLFCKFNQFLYLKHSVCNNNNNNNNKYKVFLKIKIFKKRPKMFEIFVYFKLDQSEL